MAAEHTSRTSAVHESIARVKRWLGCGAVTREVLERILVELRDLAARPELWPEADFPPSGNESRQSRYLLWEEPDHVLALYLIVWEPGKSIAPHDHTTWACIAGISGREENLLYERLDDGSVPGRAQLRFVRSAAVGPGEGIAFMPDDIHGVRVMGDAPTRTLHLYGRALEVLTERLSYDVERGTCSVKSIGVTSIRALV